MAEEFRYETKYVVLQYFGLFPADEEIVVLSGDSSVEEDGDDENLSNQREITQSLSPSELSFHSSENLDFHELHGLKLELEEHVNSEDLDIEELIVTRIAEIGDRIAKDYEREINEALEELMKRPKGQMSYEIFSGVAQHYLLSVTQNLSTWERAALILKFSRRSASKLVRAGGKGVTEMTNFSARLLEDQLATYIVEQGGWESVIRFKQPDSVTDIFGERAWSSQQSVGGGPREVEESRRAPPGRAPPGRGRDTDPQRAPPGPGRGTDPQTVDGYAQEMAVSILKEGVKQQRGKGATNRLWADGPLEEGGWGPGPGLLARLTNQAWPTSRVMGMLLTPVLAVAVVVLLRRTLLKR